MNGQNGGRNVEIKQEAGAQQDEAMRREIDEIHAETQRHVAAADERTRRAQAEIVAVRRTYAEHLQGVRSDHAQDMAEVHRQHAAELANVYRTHAVNLDILNEEHIAAMAAVARHYEQQLEDMRIAFAGEMVDGVNRILRR